MLPSSTLKERDNICVIGESFLYILHTGSSRTPSCQDVPQSNGGYLDRSTMRDTKLLSLFLFVAFVEV